MKFPYQTPGKRLFPVLFILILLTGWQQAHSYSVTQISAVYSNGQVFLTWKNPGATNLQYNVYRSATKITGSAQLTSDKLLGFVRDNSGKNIQRSQQEGGSIYFRIADNGTPLASTTGLYVVTCTDNQSWYYAVTVTNLATNKEVKKMILGSNSLSTPVAENLTKPRPVLQDSTVLSSGEVKYKYVMYGNSQETPLFPAINSTGSFGFNFYIGRRGSTASYPLYVVYGGGVSGSGLGLESSITNCYIMGLEDWLPLPEGAGSDDAQYCCYHEKFNIYSKNNPIPTSGVIKMYPQRRYIEAIRWAKNYFPIDVSRVYTKGNSQSGHAAQLTAAMIPEEIAAVYSVCEPMSLVTGGKSILRQMWGDKSSDLKTDFLNWSTGQPLTFYKGTDMRDMMNVNEPLDIPLVFDIHGKNDVTVAWSAAKVEWLDSLEANRVGGIFYWDQRVHGGNGQNFLDEETLPEFTRYTLTKSYPAFSNCSINQTPGNGVPTNGDPFGAINGYLDWADDMSDESCDYSINVMVKDLYVGGILILEQYNTCTTDITFRRLQNFHPENGVTITWKNFNNNNDLIQNGSFTYNGGLITLKNITVNRSGNRIELHIQNCEREEGLVTGEFNPNIYFYRSGAGYQAHVDADHNQELQVRLIDLSGRVVLFKKEMLIAGTNVVDIPASGTGIFLAELRGENFIKVSKLLF